MYICKTTKQIHHTMTTLRLEVKEINNNTFFAVMDRCTELNVNPREVETIVIFCDGKRKEFFFTTDKDLKFSGISLKH